MELEKCTTCVPSSHLGANNNFHGFEGVCNDHGDGCVHEKIIEENEVVRGIAEGGKNYVQIFFIFSLGDIRHLSAVQLVLAAHTAQPTAMHRDTTRTRI